MINLKFICIYICNYIALLSSMMAYPCHHVHTMRLFSTTPVFPIYHITLYGNFWIYLILKICNKYSKIHTIKRKQTCRNLSKTIITCKNLSKAHIKRLIYVQEANFDYQLEKLDIGKSAILHAYNTRYILK